MRKMFSENQIKSIVNQGIESGEISGGTKLYKHTIELEDADGNQYMFVLVNTDNTHYTIDSSINNDSGIIQYSVDNGMGVGILVYSLIISSGALTMLFIDDSGTPDNKQNDTLVDFTDTVEEF